MTSTTNDGGEGQILKQDELGRVRTPRAQREAILDQFEASGMSGIAFAAHVGDMAQIHMHTCLAHSACRLLEFIPWIRECFTDPATVRDGTFATPQQPGAGTTLRPDALDRFGVKTQ